jgi:CheY-like chemotaxis protein
VSIKVSDTGQGMEPDVIDRVFEPFFTTKEVGKGSGLGLSQVYGFVKQSEGHILIDSTPGEGTTVTLYLPRTASADAPAAADARADAAPGGDETVLIVDDNTEVREVMAVIVGSLGYEVLTAGDGVAALELIRSHCGINLLVSDIVMSGGVTGLELADRARALRPGLPVLLMSGYPAGSVEKYNFPILHKPYRREHLAKHIRAALGEPVALVQS